jgi:hypothetical protein
MGFYGAIFFLFVGSFSKVAVATSDKAQLTIIDEKTARQKLAKKLEKVNGGLDMKVAGYPGTGGGGKSYNADDGNSFMSNTTYHSYVWSYCMEWQSDKRNCKKWLDPYVSQHGFHGDKSPLEAAVANFWQGMKSGEQKSAGSGDYAIWKVQAKGGNILDDKGRLDMDQVKNMALKDQVKEGVEKVGYDTANRQISVSYDENAGKGENIMPNMESLRLMASRWTDMFARRMVAIRGQSLAAQKGVEFVTGEDMNCDQYAQQAKQFESNTEENIEGEARIKPQGELSPETKNLELEDRYKQCQMMMMANAYKPQQGENRMDAWRARVNLAAVDFGGIDPNSVPRPDGEQLSKEETTQEIADWEAGGTSMKAVRVSNAEQIQSYNNQVREAAVAMKEAASRSPFIPDASDQIAQNEIAIGQRSLIEINGLTREMRTELSDTSAKKMGEVIKSAARNAPRAPAQLTFSPAQ